MGTEVQKFSKDQIEIIKNQIAKRATDNELKLFLAICSKTGLDPFTNQIHFVKRRTYDQGTGAYIEVGTPQTGIDGYRLIADRTGKYIPADDPVFDYNEEGQLVKATATVIKIIDGREYKVSAEARYDEYVQTTKEGKPNKMWDKMPHTMLGKCAESKALRKAFPNELSGIYTREEMPVEDVDDAPVLSPRPSSVPTVKAITAPERTHFNTEPLPERKPAPVPVVEVTAEANNETIEKALMALSEFNFYEENVVARLGIPRSQWKEPQIAQMRIMYEELRAGKRLRKGKNIQTTPTEPEKPAEATVPTQQEASPVPVTDGKHAPCSVDYLKGGANGGRCASLVEEKDGEYTFYWCEVVGTPCTSTAFTGKK